MEKPVFIYFGFISVVCVFLLVDVCTAMTIKITPTRFKGDNEKNVSISCTLDAAEAAAREIMLLKISRKGEKAIAIIHPNNSISYVNGNPTEFPAKGSINGRTISKSYFGLAITDPNPEDSGAYSCNIFYIDEQGSLVEGKASGYLTVDDPALKTLKQTVNDLALKVNKGERLVLKYKMVAEEYQKKVDDLEIKTTLQDKKIANMVINFNQSGKDKPDKGDNTTANQLDLLTGLLEKEAEYKQKVSEIMGKFNVQEKTVANLLLKENEYKTKISDMEAKSTLQAKQISNLVNQLTRLSNKVTDVASESTKTSDKISKLSKSRDQMEAKVDAASQKADEVSTKLNSVQTQSNPLVAFSATNQNKYLMAKSGNILIFPDVIIEEGQGYNPKTGIFTAPEDGLYVFHLVLKLSCSGCSVRVQLIADLQVLAKLKIGMSADEHQGSISAVVKLTQGAEAYAMVDFATSRALLTMSQLSVFTGYLVNAG